MLSCTIESVILVGGGGTFHLLAPEKLLSFVMCTLTDPVKSDYSWGVGPSLIAQVCMISNH